MEPLTLDDSTEKNKKQEAKKFAGFISGVMDMTVIHLIKRKGHLEPFDEKKAYASVYWAARSAHCPEEQAEKLAQQTTQALLQWLEAKESVSSDQLFQFIGAELTRLHKDAGYLYRTHRDLS